MWGGGAVAGAKTHYSVDLSGVASVTGSAAVALDELRLSVSSTARALDAALVALAKSAVSTTLEACSLERRASGEASVTLGGQLLLASQEAVVTYVGADDEMAQATRSSDNRAVYNPARFGSGWSWN